MSASDLEKELLKAAFEKTSEEMHDSFGSIRHPDTGEFAFVTIHGHSLDDMRVSIEGSSALLQIVKARLPDESAYAMTFSANDKRGTPRVFLSYGTDDSEIAEKIARGLMESGINTWWAEWEIHSGDSIRRRIEDGLATCTHFIVLLSARSIQRPWVNEEIDAGFVRKVSATSRFIPLRLGLAVSQLPPLLSGMLCPEIDEDLANLQDIVGDIYGLSRKPALGQPPQATSTPYTGYSAAATAVAELAVKDSEHGELHSVSLNLEEIMKRTNLSRDDAVDAMYELRAFFKDHRDSWYATEKLFAEFDQFWQPWKPEDDALKLATDLVNDESFPGRTSEIAERYGWPVRRLNPAIYYLKDRGAIDVRQHLGTTPYIAGSISKSDATRRYVKSRT